MFKESFEHDFIICRLYSYVYDGKSVLYKPEILYLNNFKI